MALGLNNVYTDLRTLLVGVVSALGTNGVWEAGQAALFPWIDKGLPVCALVMDANDSDEWGITNQAAEVDVEIYIAFDLDGPPTAVITTMESVYDALIAIAYAPSSFQVLEVDPPKFGRSMPPNSPWAEKGATQRAGMVKARLLVGQQQQ
jgi:hypothetical protein